MNEWGAWYSKEDEEEIATTKTVTASQFGSRQNLWHVVFNLGQVLWIKTNTNDLQWCWTSIEIKWHLLILYRSK